MGHGLERQRNRAAKRPQITEGSQRPKGRISSLSEWSGSLPRVTGGGFLHVLVVAGGCEATSCLRRGSRGAKPGNWPRGTIQRLRRGSKRPPRR